MQSLKRPGRTASKRQQPVVEPVSEGVEPDAFDDEELDTYDTYEMYRVVCPDCAQPIALLADEEKLPEHALCASPWNPFGLTVCAGTGRRANEARPADESLRPHEQDTALLLTLPGASTGAPSPSPTSAARARARCGCRRCGAKRPEAAEPARVTLLRRRDAGGGDGARRGASGRVRQPVFARGHPRTHARIRPPVTCARFAALPRYDPHVLVGRKPAPRVRTGACGAGAPGPAGPGPADLP